MNRVKVRIIGSGFHPNELLVAITAADGTEEKLVVDKRSVMEDSILVGYPIDRSEGNVLVELPRESIRGIWRVWVSSMSLVENSAA